MVDSLRAPFIPRMPMRESGVPALEACAGAAETANDDLWQPHSRLHSGADGLVAPPADRLASTFTSEVSSFLAQSLDEWYVEMPDEWYATTAGKEDVDWLKLAGTEVVDSDNTAAGFVGVVVADDVEVVGIEQALASLRIYS